MTLTQLEIIYDDRCALCQRCAAKLTTEPAYIKLKPISRTHAANHHQYKHLMQNIGQDEMVAVGNDGSVYRGEKAYLMCLWATRRWRKLSIRLSRPALRGAVRSACHLIARSRHLISGLISVDDDEQIATKLKQADPPRCVSNSTPN